jgi:hypothetical protein
MAVSAISDPDISRPRLKARYFWIGGRLRQPVTKPRDVQ